MCFVWISEQTAIISLYSINLPVSKTEAESVYCAVRIVSFKSDRYSFVLKGLIVHYRKKEVRPLSKYSQPFSSEDKNYFFLSYRCDRFEERWSYLLDVKLFPENTIFELSSGFGSVPRTLRRSLHCRALTLSHFDISVITSHPFAKMPDNSSL